MATTMITSALLISSHDEKIGRHLGRILTGGDTTINDPVERQRRLAQAYGLIMEFGRQKRAVAQIKSDVTADPRSEEESQC